LEEFHPRKNGKGGKRRQCKVCQAEDRRRWLENNPEKIKEQNRRYYATHREEENERCRRYRAANLEKAREKSHRYRAREAGAEGSFTAEEFQQLCAATGDFCLRCGAAGVLTTDHIIPLSRGGLNDISNIQPLCGPCNSQKGAQALDYRSRVLH